MQFISLDEYISSGLMYFDQPEDLIKSLKNPVNNPLLEQGEFFPLYYNSGPKTLKMLDLLVKEFKPSVVVETGFGNGVSSKQILSSFKELGLNDSKLYSFDTDPIVKSTELMNDPQFNLILIKSPRYLTMEMNKIGKIDMFYHDSNHSYQNQSFEYDLAWKMLNDGGILATDDVNLSDAFFHFCKRFKKAPLLLCDNGKYSGCIIK
jgi:predicted O-methyltransferase YrrM